MNKQLKRFLIWFSENFQNIKDEADIDQILEKYSKYKKTLNSKIVLNLKCKCNRCRNTGVESYTVGDCYGRGWSETECERECTVCKGVGFLMPKTTLQNNGKYSFEKITQFEDINFSYDGRDHLLSYNKDLSIPKSPVYDFIYGVCYNVIGCSAPDWIKEIEHKFKCKINLSYDLATRKE